MTNIDSDIRVLEAPKLRGGTPVVVGTIPAGLLTERHVVPRRDFRHKTGYQREVSVARVNRLMSELRAGRVDLPTAVLLNMREFDDSHLIANDLGKSLKLDDDHKLYVVDGQHRIEALRRLIEEDPDRWSSLGIAFICMLGASERVEMREFYVVNSTAKSVRTDLALDLLKQQAEADPSILEGLIERSEDWKVRGQTLVEKLAQESPIWRGRVRFPGEPRADTTITNSGLVTSLKPLLGAPYFGQLKIEDQVKILDSFWKGVREVLSEPFDDPTRFVLQKMTGTLVMHSILVMVIEYVRSHGWSVVDATSYVKAMNKPLQQLQGDTREGEVVSGTDFWRAGAEGAAGSFSSNAGRRVLTAKIRAMLPELELE